MADKRSVPCHINKYHYLISGCSKHGDQLRHRQAFRGDDRRPDRKRSCLRLLAMVFSYFTLLDQLAQAIEPLPRERKAV